MAVGGVVVSNPIAKNTTSRVGYSRAMRSASAAEYTMRISAPAAFAFVRLARSEAGTRIVSAYVHRIAPCSSASAIALSIRPIGSTHTGQPGPCTISTLAGRRSVTP